MTFDYILVFSSSQPDAWLCLSNSQRLFQKVAQEYFSWHSEVLGNSDGSAFPRTSLENYSGHKTPLKGIFICGDISLNHKCKRIQKLGMWRDCPSRGDKCSEELCSWFQTFSTSLDLGLPLSLLFPSSSFSFSLFLHRGWAIISHIYLHPLKQNFLHRIKDNPNLWDWIHHGLVHRRSHRPWSIPLCSTSTVSSGSTTVAELTGSLPTLDQSEPFPILYRLPSHVSKVSVTAPPHPSSPLWIHTWEHRDLNG